MISLCSFPSSFCLFTSVFLFSYSEFVAQNFPSWSQSICPYSFYMGQVPASARLQFFWRWTCPQIQEYSRSVPSTNDVLGCILMLFSDIYWHKWKRRRNIHIPLCTQPHNRNSRMEIEKPDRTCPNSRCPFHCFFKGLTRSACGFEKGLKPVWTCE